MDSNKEYHDPDYPEAPVGVEEEPPSLSNEQKCDKIKAIIHREFSSELETRESEVMQIDQRLTSSRRLLHRLRYSIVSRYYQQQKLLLTNTELQDEIAEQRDPKARAEASSLLRESQRAIHPSVRKLLGKKTVDMDEIFRTRGPRNKTRKDYSAMIKSRNYTISADSTKTLRPGNLEPDPLPKKVPRHFEPKITNVISLSEAQRNQNKHRYRIIIGNTSKYVPSSSRLDKSTHKWLLYVRAAPPQRGAEPPAAGAEPCPVPASVFITLHHSYAPHHTLTIDKPPFQVSRRGWGEFPAKIELHFPLPERNRPVLVEHTIKLDRNYTGLQMLGSETVLDVWLYSTPEMLPFIYQEEEQPNIQTNTQQQPLEQIEIKQIDEPDWLDFFKTPTELDVDEMIIKPNNKKEDHQKEAKIDYQKEIKTEPDLETKNNENDYSNNENDYTNNENDYSNNQNDIDAQNHIQNESNQPTTPKKRIVKYIDPNTGKIYYLEMDRQLDLTKVQEIVINNTTAKIAPITNGVKNQKRKKGVSLLKPEIKNQINETKSEISKIFSHIENDHCYLAAPRELSNVTVKKEKILYNTLISNIHRFSEIKQAVNYLIKHIPLISEEVRDPDFVKHFPFVVENSLKYWKLDFAKRRNIEWSRAKLINRILSDYFPEQTWRTKQILVYARLHGYHPIRDEVPFRQSEDWPWNNFDSQTNDNLKEIYPNTNEITSLTPFNFDANTSLTDVMELSDDEEIDILNESTKVSVKKEPNLEVGSLKTLPVESSDDRLRFMFIERKCADIGIELRNEDVGNGYCYSAVHAVLLSAMKSFAEELIRSSLAGKRRRNNPGADISVWAGGSSVCGLSVRDVWECCGGGGGGGGGAGGGGRAQQLVSRRGLARTDIQTTNI